MDADSSLTGIGIFYGNQMIRAEVLIGYQGQKLISGWLIISLVWDPRLTLQTMIQHQSECPLGRPGPGKTQSIHPVSSLWIIKHLGIDIHSPGVCIDCIASTGSAGSSVTVNK